MGDVEPRDQLEDGELLSESAMTTVALGTAVVGSALGYPFYKGIEALSSQALQHPNIATGVLSGIGIVSSIFITERVYPRDTE